MRLRRHFVSDRPRRACICRPAHFRIASGGRVGLGARILLRTHARVALTDAGQRLLPVARRILRPWNRCPEPPRRTPPLRVRSGIGTRYEVGLSWSVRAGRLARKHPERTLHLYNGSSDDLAAKMDRGEIDAAVISARLGSPGFDLRDPAPGRIHPGRGRSADSAVRRTRERLTLVDVGPDLPLFRSFLDASAGPGGLAVCPGRIHGGHRQRPEPRAGGGRARGRLPTFFVKDDLAKRRLTRLLPRVDLAIRQSPSGLALEPSPARRALALAGDLREARCVSRQWLPRNELRDRFVFDPDGMFYLLAQSFFEPLQPAIELLARLVHSAPVARRRSPSIAWPSADSRHLASSAGYRVSSRASSSSSSKRRATGTSAEQELVVADPNGGGSAPPARTLNAMLYERVGMDEEEFPGVHVHRGDRSR